ncbi:hypothetical protein [Salipiger bermudensis]|uniref:hypothetical protein n=1 Tax=Salipiger bermudensis TaxID=344736 RepID=UPI001A907BBD|nr:hypothetical protein [Salipiger bermudensis]MBN9674631.1 hypothetical protein [Salipiger bermudensis]
MSAFKRALLLMFALSGVVILLALAITPSEEEIAAQQAARDADPTSGATYACREFIKASLVSPSSAEFGAWSGWEKELLDDGSVRVEAEFEAENAMGATLPGRMICVVREEGEKWFLEGLEDF